MFQKFAPLIVLAMFIVATIFIMIGLEHASDITNPHHHKVIQDR